MEKVLNLILCGIKKRAVKIVSSWSKPAENPVCIFLYNFWTLLSLLLFMFFHSILLSFILSHISNPAKPPPLIFSGQVFSLVSITGPNTASIYSLSVPLSFPSKNDSFFFILLPAEMICQLGCSFSLSKPGLLIQCYKHLEFALASPTWLWLLCGKCYHG